MGRDGNHGLKGDAFFLASPASDYVTRHNLVVVGGFTIWPQVKASRCSSETPDESSLT